MANPQSAPSLAAVSAVAALTAPAPHGNIGVAISEIVPSIVSLAARAGHQADLAAAIAASAGATLPPPGHISHSADLSFLGVAPGRWFVIAPPAPPALLEFTLRQALGAYATLTDQTDGRAVLRINGPAAVATLAKLVPLDLHPSVFGAGRVAQTIASHINIMIWRNGAGQSFDIAVFRGFALSFAESLIASAAEFGVSFTPNLEGPAP